MTGDYRTPAKSSYNVAASPYWGVDGVYSSSLDPWQIADNRQFMQQYYQLTTQYAQKGGINYPVSDCAGGLADQGSDFAVGASCVVAYA